jgi:hypothetical protein
VAIPGGGERVLGVKMGESSGLKLSGFLQMVPLHAAV